jgi:hypothetical protein
MAASVANNAKGRVAELGRRVINNDPANSALILAAFASTATHATIKDLRTLADVEADANTAEVRAAARVVLTDASSITVTPDNTNDLNALDFPDPTFRAVAGGTNITHLGLFYDSDTTGGTDANIELLCWYDWAATPNGGDLTVQVNASGAFTAT